MPHLNETTFEAIHVHGVEVPLDPRAVIDLNSNNTNNCSSFQLIKTAYMESNSKKPYSPIYFYDPTNNMLIPASPKDTVKNGIFFQVVKR